MIGKVNPCLTGLDLVWRDDCRLLELGTLLAVEVGAAEGQAGEGVCAERAPGQGFSISAVALNCK